MNQLQLGPQLRLLSIGKDGVDFVPPQLLPSASGWRELAEEAYLSADTDITEWSRLFISLGVCRFPALLQTPGLPNGDWHSPALDALLQSLCSSKDVDRLAAVLSELVGRWRVVEGGDWGLRDRCLIGGALPDALLINPEAAQTRVLASLREASWLVGSDGHLHTPSELWLRSDELTAALGDLVPYVGGSSPMPGEMATTYYSLLTTY